MSEIERDEHGRPTEESLCELAWHSMDYYEEYLALRAQFDEEIKRWINLKISRK